MSHNTENEYLKKKKKQVVNRNTEKSTVLQRI